MGKLLYKSKCLFIPIDAGYKFYTVLYLIVYVMILLMLFSLQVKYTGTFKYAFLNSSSENFFFSNIQK